MNQKPAKRGSMAIYSWTEVKSWSEKWQKLKPIQMSKNKKEKKPQSRVKVHWVTQFTMRLDPSRYMALTSRGWVRWSGYVCVFKSSDTVGTTDGLLVEFLLSRSCSQKRKKKDRARRAGRGEKEEIWRGFVDLIFCLYIRWANRHLLPENEISDRISADAISKSESRLTFLSAAQP